MRSFLHLLFLVASGLGLLLAAPGLLLLLGASQIADLAVRKEHADHEAGLDAEVL